MKNMTLGTIEASEMLIRELYIDLRGKVNSWASITNQTAQARMGYVGQHLVSVATGYKGGKSGARGKDLLLPNNEYAEIKTCYRVDQLGRCNKCGAQTASIEVVCSSCGSSDIHRNDDSKWLIGIRNDDELDIILDPKYYYLVLFDFVNITDSTDINASIWRVDSKNVGFAFCMIDYYFNIRAKSKSHAPFNMWPYQLKFYLMKPILIYKAIITADNKIKTIIFPGKQEPVLEPMAPLTDYTRSTNLTYDKLVNISKILKITSPATDKTALAIQIEKFVSTSKHDREILREQVAKELYYDHIKNIIPNLPQHLKSQVLKILKDLR